MIILILITIIIGLIIYCNVSNKESYKTIDKCQKFIDFDQIKSYMSTDFDLLIIKNNEFDIYKYDGQNLNVNPKYFKFHKNYLTSVIDGYKQKWVKAPLRLSPLYYSIKNITLDELLFKGGIYCNEDNIEEPMVVEGNNKFYIPSIGILELIEPFANTRQQMDKLKYFKNENGLIGNIKGYRDKDQKFNIQWICWSRNNKILNYGTILKN